MSTDRKWAVLKIADGSWYLGSQRMTCGTRVEILLRGGIVATGRLEAQHVGAKPVPVVHIRLGHPFEVKFKAQELSAKRHVIIDLETGEQVTKDACEPGTDADPEGWRKYPNLDRNEWTQHSDAKEVAEYMNVEYGHWPEAIITQGFEQMLMRPRFLH